MSKGSKKLFNAAGNVIQDAIAGLLSTSTTVTTISGRRVVIRADVDSIKGRVAVLCGGGSGHEPFASGFVGNGMLDAAVAGAIFASPPVSDILSALLALKACGATGILVIVINYTGDRINFGLAVEKARARSPDFEFATVTVAEDCALQSANKAAGKRGLAGVAFAIKVAGSMARDKMGLQEITSVLRKWVLPPNLGTIGLCLSPCTIPGSQGSSFTLEDDEMVLGLGIHGEAGVKRMKLVSASEAVKAMLQHMMDKESNSSLHLDVGGMVAVIVNNLGSSTNLEIAILKGEVKTQLETTYKVQVARMYSGLFVTSLDMNGFSISILKLCDQNPSLVLGCLDDPVVCPAWCGSSVLCDLMQSDLNLLPFEDPLSRRGMQEAPVRGREATPFVKAMVEKSIEFVCDALLRNENELNLMDSGAGDADCGSTLRRGAEGLLKKLASDRELCAYPALVFGKIADVAERDMGGTSGALYSIFFQTAHTVLIRAGSLTYEDFVTALEKGKDHLMGYGMVSEGDRTLLDALSPGLRILAESSNQSTVLQQLVNFELATQAAEKGAVSTLKMKAVAGRASYVASSESVHPDPGAHAVGIIFRAVYEGCQNVAINSGMIEG